MPDKVVTLLVKTHCVLQEETRRRIAGTWLLCGEGFKERINRFS
jgi:hypothetical protein